MCLALILPACGKLKEKDPQDLRRIQVERKRQQAACGSSGAYDRLKGALFDQAIARHGGDRTNLDLLADYSFARVENPVVVAWDPMLDVTRCKGRLILEFPPGAERGFGGQRRLEAPIEYAAQASADGAGLVYQPRGAEEIVARLAAFDIDSGSYRPPPAIDQAQAGPPPTVAPRAAPTVVGKAKPVPAAPPPTPVPRSPPAQPASKPPTPPSAPAADEGGEATVRAFYGALGAGNGAAAAARIVPEKRASRAFSPGAMNRFYGGLAEPIRLTGATPVAGGAYRVSYRYSTGRAHCNGSAVVMLTRRGGRTLIRSIRALSGC